MAVLRVIGEFLYDLLVGDSWPLALAAAVVIAAGAAMVAAGLLPGALAPAYMLVAIMAVVPVVVIAEARAAGR